MNGYGEESLGQNDRPFSLLFWEAEGGVCSVLFSVNRS